MTRESAAQGIGPRYYIAEFRVSELRSQNIEVTPEPEPGNPGHAILPQLRTANRKDTATLERMKILEKLAVGNTYGPYEKMSPMPEN